MRMMRTLLAVVLLSGVSALAETAAWSDKKAGNFHGYTSYDFPIGDAACRIVLPKTAAAGNPWIWRARFWGHEPQTDVALLEKGFHVFYCEVGNLFGAPTAVERWNKAYAFLVNERGLSAKPALEGMSRGGLIIFNWAKANPDKVACIYADAPVCDIRSWPGKNGGGTWKACLTAYGITEEQAATFTGNPIDNLEPLAKAKVPVLAVCGEADDVVPMVANINVLAERYRALGGSVEIIAKPGVGHHPHSLKDPKPIVDFVLKHTGQQ